MINIFLVFLFLIEFANSSLHHDPHFFPNRTTLVHLFEWKWSDIANECEQFLGPSGYAGVQVSPVNENIVIENRPWYERYQPISYQLTTRSGTIDDLTDMVKRCNDVGVRIYADAVINHMAAIHDQPIIGTGRSIAKPNIKEFPSVPYSNLDFHQSCQIQDYNNIDQVRNCELSGLLDLDQSKPYVQEKIADYLNSLIEIGIAGFRIDAAKHMWPKDLEAIYTKLKNLNTSFKFPQNSKPFIFQEVIDLGGEPIKKNEYNHMGVVTEFLHSKEIGILFRSGNKLKWLKNWGPEWNFLQSSDALIFVDNHDNQRGHGAGGTEVLTYKNEILYKLANAFMLAHPYGIAEIMSSFNFTAQDQGPPKDKNENIKSPIFNSKGYCTEKSGWVCEHRWKEIVNMVEFRNVVNGTNITHWWDNDNDQIAFGRGNKGFIVINNENEPMMNTILQTGLPQGHYCNIYEANKNNCKDNDFRVGNDGKINIKMLKSHKAIALHINEKL